ncbi:MAG TPA: MEDS domain-containing protein [Blastocatellia bacterium]|nr:MEDS domain-containing protein [Blastocatellia bacterium]
MTVTNEPVRLAGGIFDRSLGHACAFFHSEEEKYRALLPFIQEGFERGDRVIHIADPERRAAHLRQLEEAGLNAASGQGCRSV